MEKMPFVPVSWGEVIDKITILEIKEQRIADPAAVANVSAELAALQAIVGSQPGLSEVIADFLKRLRAANLRLWELEDSIRLKEREGEFDPDFIRMARSIYVENDERAAIKREINRITGSALVEEKSYRR